MSAVNDPTPQPTPPGAEAIQAGPPPAASPTGVQAAPPTEAPPIPLPPRPRPEPLTPEELGRAMVRLDRMLLALLVVLTALVAVFPIRNIDFWFHLATARDWLGNKFSLGQDPYSFTAAGSGQSLLAVRPGRLRAVPGVRRVRRAGRRRGQGRPAPGAARHHAPHPSARPEPVAARRLHRAAVLAMSPGFVMQPAVVSLLLLGVTLALCCARDFREEPEADRKHRAATPVPWLGEPADRPLWLLVPLFAVWVNLDAWFVLGPFAVLLYLAGLLAEALFAQGRPDAPRPGARRPLAAVLAPAPSPASSARSITTASTCRGRSVPGACSRPSGGTEVRPVAVLAPPGGVFSAGNGAEPGGRGLLPAGAGRAGVVPARGPGSPGAGPCCGAASSCSRWPTPAPSPSSRSSPAPSPRLNFQEYAARRFGTVPVAVGWLKEWSLLGRGLSVLAVFVLALLAWPGWLFTLPWEGRAPGAEDRRVGLGAEPPAGLVRLAGQLDEWQRDGTLTDADHGLNLEPDVTGGLAWLCRDYRPRAFFDYRFENYSPEVAGQYIDLRRKFEPSDAETDVKNLADEADKWRPVLAGHGITYVIASDGCVAATSVCGSACAGIGGRPPW